MRGCFYVGREPISTGRLLRKDGVSNFVFANRSLRKARAKVGSVPLFRDVSTFLGEKSRKKWERQWDGVGPCSPVRCVDFCTGRVSFDTRYDMSAGENNFLTACCRNFSEEKR